MIVIGNRSYEVLVDHRNGWNPEAFRERYSEVLERYDYIVGDWGYNQLRLKGFYRDNHPKAPKDSLFSTLSDYINEYCNFGCAYFVLQKSKEIKDPKELKELQDRERELREQEAAAIQAEQAEAESSASHERSEPREGKPKDKELREHRSARSPKAWKESKNRDKEGKGQRPPGKERN